MEQSTTPTTRFERIKAFAVANQMMLFMGFFLLVAVGIVTYLGVDNVTLHHDNALMRDILSPDCPCDSVWR